MTWIRRVAWDLGAPVRALLIVGIRLYRLTLAGAVGGQCRFYPSCSHYAEQAVRDHGAARGSLMAAWRVIRCGPFTSGGVDRVPPARDRAGDAPAYDCVIQEHGVTR